MSKPVITGALAGFAFSTAMDEAVKGHAWHALLTALMACWFFWKAHSEYAARDLADG